MYQLGTLLNRLEVLLGTLGLGVLLLEPGLDALVLGVEMVEVLFVHGKKKKEREKKQQQTYGHEILDDVHMGQGVDL